MLLVVCDSFKFLDTTSSEYRGTHFLSKVFSSFILAFSKKPVIIS